MSEDNLEINTVWWQEYNLIKAQEALIKEEIDCLNGLILPSNLDLPSSTTGISLPITSAYLSQLIDLFS